MKPETKNNQKRPTLRKVSTAKNEKTDQRDKLVKHVATFGIIFHFI